MEFERRRPEAVAGSSSGEEARERKRLIVVLDNASLETAKIGAEYQLLNSDDHAHFLKKHKKDPKWYRPDITHQCLLTLLDSPLNKAGLLQVYIQTSKNVLIEVNPKLRIPRTFRRFCGLMVQLLHKLKIRATDGSETLLKVVKNPIDRHLPSTACKFTASFRGHLVKLGEFVPTLPDGKPVVFVVGAFAHGDVEVDYTDEDICFSEYPLSAALACAKLSNAFEESWDIL